MKHIEFDEDHILAELKHFLPSQQALKDFIHHNPLHAFQHLKFYDAITKASNIFGYQVSLRISEYRQLFKQGRIREDVLERVISKKMGIASMPEWKNKLLFNDYDARIEPKVGRLRKKWKKGLAFDLDEAVHPKLFRILCSFLDQGIAIAKFPVGSRSFTESLRILEERSYSSFFKTKKIRQQFIKGEYTLESLLLQLAGRPELFEQYLFDQQFAHPGWSGFVAMLETFPHTLLDQKQISLKELVAFELLLEVDALTSRFGNNWKPASEYIEIVQQNLFDSTPTVEFNKVIELWQEAFEWSYYETVFAGILLSPPPGTGTGQKSFQAVFCIDERECSIRRHLESTQPSCETFGAPGFFGVEFYFQQQGSLFYDKLCPAPVTPQFLIKEIDAVTKHSGELLYSKHSHTFLSGMFFSLGLGYLSFLRMLQNLFRPRMSAAISNAFTHMAENSKLTIENIDPSHQENGLQIGYTPEEMSVRAEGFLRGIGMVRDFSPLIYLVAHGSSSANNPHHGAHDCGACSGRPGATNARVMAYILNLPVVRAALSRRDISIPSSARFIGAMHDTAADTIRFYDDQQLSNEQCELHLGNKASFELALDLNAKERSRRFASINTKQDAKAIRKEILKRSVSLFEPRPELGHGTNTLCIVGRREITKKLFLDRRAFLNSYDHTTDPDGKVLANVMRPIGLVCGGINLEYYFSRVDNIKMGAGTKLPHNVMGLFGVANSSDGDLRPGLPWQMIEVHDPVRLLVIVEHIPEVVLNAIQSTPEVFEWYKNEWVHIAAFHPHEKRFYYFEGGKFVLYDPIKRNIEEAGNLMSLVENSAEMKTNHITHATEENLPVYLLND